MDIQYDFNDILDNTPLPPADINRPDFRVAICCGTCKYFWRLPGNAFGFCRVGRMDYLPPDQHTPNFAWRDNHVYYATVCNRHVTTMNRRTRKKISKKIGVRFDKYGKQSGV